VLMMAAALFLTAPAVVAGYYYVELERGSFPVDADSIGIPIFWFVTVLIVTAPITWGFIWLCVRRYPGSVSLGVWNRRRPLWALAWTIVVSAIIAMFLILTPWRNATYHPFLVLHVVMDVLLLLILRGAIVAEALERSDRRPHHTPLGNSPL
jgi:hypothetical protein